VNHNLKLFVLRLAIAALLAPVIPAFAQDATGFDYQFEGLALAQPASAAPAALRVASDQVGFQLASDQLELTGTVRCVTADAACQDGQAVTLALGNTNGRLAITDGTSNTIFFSEIVVSSQTPEGQSFGPFSGYARGSLSCDGAACQTLNVQVVACSTGGARQLGVVLNGSLAGPKPLSNLMEEDGTFYYEWSSLGGTAYLTQADSSNPICGGRDLDAVYADGYQPGALLPGRSADLPTETLPNTQGGVVDRDIVIKDANARLTDQGLQIGVRGYFFGQCGVEPQSRVWDDTDIVHVMIYRVIPDGTTCTGGVESFSLILPYIEQDNVYTVGDHFPVNVNGQIIAILIGL
jgi:hypothetical protein